jgi:hypothetical protein
VNKKTFSRVAEPKIGQTYRLKVHYCGEAVVKLTGEGSSHWTVEILDGGFHRGKEKFYRGHVFFVPFSSSADWWEEKV